MFTKRKDYLSFLLPLLLILAAIFSLTPIIIHFKSSLTEAYDAVFVNWILGQTIGKIPLGLAHIFESNIFYGYKNTLTFSELLIPSAFISYIPTKILGEPAVASNFAFVFSQIATLLVIYFWWKDFTKNSLSAFIASLALGLSQIRFNYYMHLQMWAMEWWLLSAFFFWKFVKGRKKIFIVLSALFFIIQFWESIQPVFWLATIFVILFFSNIKVFFKNWKLILLLALLILISVFPVAHVYLLTSHEFGFSRSIREVANFSGSIDDYWKYFASPGLYILFGLAFAKIYAKKGSSREVRWLWVLLIISFLMSLGPVLKADGHTVKLFGKIFIPLPYGIFYYVIPGLNALRTPSRWAWLVAFSMSGIIAYSFKNLTLTKLKGKIFFLIFILLAVIGGTTLKSSVPVPLTKNYPEVYKWLKYEPGNVVLEYPIYSWGGPPAKSEVYRMFFSLYTNKNLINGYSGFFPPRWEQMLTDLSNPKVDVSLEDILSRYNLKAHYIIIHEDELSTVEKSLELCPNVKTVFIDNDMVCVY